jgi:hypothetical protein
MIGIRHPGVYGVASKVGREAGRWQMAFRMTPELRKPTTGTRTANWGVLPRFTAAGHLYFTSGNGKLYGPKAVRFRHVEPVRTPGLVSPRVGSLDSLKQ